MPPKQFKQTTLQCFSTQAKCDDSDECEDDENDESSSLEDFIKKDDASDSSSNPSDTDTASSLEDDDENYEPASKAIKLSPTNAKTKLNKTKKVRKSVKASTVTKKKVRKAKEVPEQKPLNSSFHPESEWSCTVSRRGHDVAPSVMVNAQLFLDHYTSKGVIAYETGARMHNGHLQCVIRTRCPRTTLGKKLLIKELKAMLPDNGKGHTVQAKVLSPTQHFTTMIGYCTKDSGKSHYQIVTKNISAQVSYTCFPFFFYIQTVIYSLIIIFLFIITIRNLVKADANMRQ